MSRPLSINSRRYTSKFYQFCSLLTSYILNYVYIQKLGLLETRYFYWISSQIFLKDNRKYRSTYVMETWRK